MNARLAVALTSYKYQSGDLKSSLSEESQSGDALTVEQLKHFQELLHDLKLQQIRFSGEDDEYRVGPSINLHIGDDKPTYDSRLSSIKES